MVNKGTGSIVDFRKKITYIHELISTAYHEAGHTVYGLLHFMKIESVCVFENKKLKRIEGLTHFDSPDLSQFNDPVLLNRLLHSEICFRYAGLTAEKYFFRSISGSDKFPVFLKDGSSDDTLRAGYLIRQYNVAPPGKKRYAYKKKAINQTLYELQCNWDAITIISHALFERRSLDFSEIKNLLIKNSDNKEFWKNQFKIIESIYQNNAHLDEEFYKYILSE